MQVTLKKAKITSSILNQTVSVVSLDNFKDFEPLGWVLHAKERWLIFHKDGVLVKVLSGSVLSIKLEHEQVDDRGNFKDFYYVIVKRGNRYDQRFKFETEQEAKTHKEKYEETIINCKNKGQFYV